MKNLIKKLVNKETILYALFGVITSIINVLVFYILYKFNIDYKISNIIALITAKTAAYLCNKNFVFKSHCNSIKELFKEFMSFIFFRGITLLLDYFGLILFVEVLRIDELISKIIVTAIVIIINYIVGKKYIFNRGNYEKKN